MTSIIVLECPIALPPVRCQSFLAHVNNVREELVHPVLAQRCDELEEHNCREARLRLTEPGATGVVVSEVVGEQEGRDDWTVSVRRRGLQNVIIQDGGHLLNLSDTFPGVQ